MSWDGEHYDIFISYARVDDPDSSWVTALVKCLQRYLREAGLPPRIFFDTGKIETAQLWEERIVRALKTSDVMVSVLSPSYFKSPWCGREWDYFITVEKAKRGAGALSRDQGLVFPVKRFEVKSKNGLTAEEMERLASASQRQQMDFVGVAPPGKQRGGQFETRVKELAAEILAVLRRMRGSARPVTRIGTNREQFVERLSEATEVTIIGITHENLVEYLTEALARMRKELGPEAFWQRIRVVFLAEKMMPFVDDELLNRYGDRDRATYERAGNARRAKNVLYRFFLRQDRPDLWSIYDYNAMLPFLGAFFVKPDGQMVVQVATLRPGLPTSQHLVFEFSGVGSDISYYQAAFDEVILRSRQEQEVILVGHPRSGKEPGFICKHSQYLRALPMPGKRRDEWVAAVIMLLWREEHGVVHPLLQVRTSENSVRELGMLSNLSGYVNLEDMGSATIQPFEVLPKSAYENAVYRELQEELGVQQVDIACLERVGEYRYYSIDRENLYFYVVSARLETSLDDVQPSARLRPCRLGELVKAREYQVVKKGLKFFDELDRSAIDVLADNLTLHDMPDLAERLRHRRAVRDEFQRLEVELRPVDDSALGLAGLQYREFFSVMIPTYARLGVEGAAEYLASIDRDEARAQARDRLERYYRDGDLIRRAHFDV